MSVTWTPDAEAQVTAAHAQVGRGGPHAAAKWAGRVRTRTDALAGQPGAGAEVPEYGDPAVHELYEHPYRVLYRVADDGTVTVIAVHHSARRLPRTPPG